VKRIEARFEPQRLERRGRRRKTGPRCASVVRKRKTMLNTIGGERREFVNEFDGRNGPSPHPYKGKEGKKLSTLNRNNDAQASEKPKKGKPV